MTVFDRYLEQAKDFARKLVRAETGTRRWATVTAIDPVRITYDGTTTQGIISPVVLGVPVNVGDRVRAHTIHDKTYITRANPTPVIDTDWQPITFGAAHEPTSHGPPCEVRRVGDLVTVHGRIQRVSGADYNAGHDYFPCSLPDERFYPRGGGELFLTPTWGTVDGSGGGFARLEWGLDGRLQVSVVGVSSRWIALNGTWRV